jgi:hypothetical protein
MPVWSYHCYRDKANPNLAHARLQEHIAGMSGQLEARIHEGGKDLPCFNSIFLCILPLVWRCRARHCVATACLQLLRGRKKQNRIRKIK